MAILTPTILSAALLAQVGQVSPGLGTDPTSFDAQIDEAMVKHDTAFLSAVVADDARFMTSPTVSVSKAQWLEMVKTYQGIERVRESVEVETHADVALTSGRVRIRLANPDAEFDTTFLRVYVHRGDRWQFLSQRTLTVNRLQPSSSQASLPPGVVRPGNGVTLPRVIHEVRPNYTSEAMKAKIQGGVLLECVVLTDGSVGTVKVVRSLDATYGLDEAAINAAKQWRFQPGTRNGEPVPVMISIELTFTLGKD